MKLQIVFAVLVLVSASCGKKQESGASKATGSAEGQPADQPAGQPAAAGPKQDLSKPRLTDDNVRRFIASMKESGNPFGPIIKSGGRIQDIPDLEAKALELNAFARRHGFEDYSEYADIAARIMLGVMLYASNSMVKSLSDATKTMFEQTIKHAEEELKKPDLDAELRKMYQEQLETSKKELAEVVKDPNMIEAVKKDGTLNDADLVIIKKHEVQLQQIMKELKVPLDKEECFPTREEPAPAGEVHAVATQISRWDAAGMALCGGGTPRS
jgi:hypothetical protein